MKRAAKRTTKRTAKRVGERQEARVSCHGQGRGHAFLSLSDVRKMHAKCCVESVQSAERTGCADHGPVVNAVRFGKSANGRSVAVWCTGKVRLVCEQQVDFVGVHRTLFANLLDARGDIAQTSRIGRVENKHKNLRSEAALLKVLYVVLCAEVVKVQSNTVGSRQDGVALNTNGWTKRQRAVVEGCSMQQASD